MEPSRNINQPRTWIVDLDGTIVIHNGYKIEKDMIIEGSLEFFKSLPPDDMVVLITAREKRYEKETMEFLNSNGIRIDHCIFGAPKGLRILINDKKPDGEPTAECFNLDRNEGLFSVKS